MDRVNAMATLMHHAHWAKRHGAMACEAFKEAYPVGQHVRWDHGDYIRSGEVIDHGSSHSWEHARLIVRTPTGAVVGVDACRVMTFDGIWPTPVGTPPSGEEVGGG